MVNMILKDGDDEIGDMNGDGGFNILDLVQIAEIIEPSEDVKADIDVMDKKLIKKKKWLQRRRELHSWFKRAEAVGIAPMPARRPTKGQRLAWEESIIQAEGL